MRLGQRNLFVLTLAPDGDGVGGYFERPAVFRGTNFLFSRMHGVRRDHYAMAVSGKHAKLAFDDLPPAAVLRPYPFARAATGAPVSTDW